ncbi:MAG TPA: SDR family NAD(P)-dependent oxidoreductase [Gordonia sp. (in: high G+C Gram-positive bacteria)]|uniref:SDR family NAD(P)-dependent oxidoreductase n=1 Tax=unclassified Gordonia (in: high G+C Gram-positive bacteria) TaxID=2657482 RepID=UPI000FA6F5B4|nr:MULTISPECIES: SDR family NAD(P)-dependent oxidoreductase [unclassified Gordonia (in: high G+C Gram-positive bacteria)]RUP40368.1 MAG: SDR family NAD(P)-dependent oxidoreductase [Gordonia sp. (in: high G+C Gram-positive bacteria)]HNP57071.1 SDR family NAD(P)-dependent oxidoreductase [Gordonia sp. (in: high G+C Gram-positive bacteria)]HRC49392.1 SDR family NAD(P)-dependent oxidoreductase [Gordonia sp. (in: high G+C Gram-positive bacteria)]
MSVWFITGTSSGIGAALAAQVLADGNSVIGTFRSAAQATAFDGAAPGRSFGMVADVCDDDAVRAAVADGTAKAGAPEVVVNAAGYGLVGAVEEVDDAEMLAQVDVNLFGAHRVIRAVLPAMRSARAGHVVNISSVAGLVGSPGLGAYDASKAGLELLSEALHTEVAPLGIHVTIVEPGNIRTQWAGRSMVFAKERIADYDATAGVSRTFYPELSGKQVGEASVVASTIRAAVASDDPPLRLVVGDDAHGWIKDKLDQEYSDLAHWQPSN